MAKTTYNRNFGSNPLDVTKELTESEKRDAQAALRSIGDLLSELNHIGVKVKIKNGERTTFPDVQGFHPVSGEIS